MNKHLTYSDADWRILSWLFGGCAENCAKIIRRVGGINGRASIIIATTNNLPSQQHHDSNEIQYRIEPVHDLNHTSQWLKNNRKWSTRTRSPPRIRITNQRLQSRKAGGQQVRTPSMMRAWRQRVQD